MIETSFASSRVDNITILYDKNSSKITQSCFSFNEESDKKSSSSSSKKESSKKNDKKKENKNESVKNKMENIERRIGTRSSKANGEKEKSKINSEEEKRKKHQAELERKKLEEAEKLYKSSKKKNSNNNNNSDNENENEGSSSTNNKNEGSSSNNINIGNKNINKNKNFGREDIVGYENEKQLPNEIGTTPHQIFVDTKRECVLLPFYGQLVPFHISTIKSCSKNEYSLRINFNYPILLNENDLNTNSNNSNNNNSLSMNKNNSNNKNNLNNKNDLNKNNSKNDLNKSENEINENNQNKIFVRELAYKVPNLNNLNTYHRLINEIRKRSLAREKETTIKNTLVAQEALILSKGRVPRLTDLYARPSIGGRRVTGALELHKNGFRYKGNKGGTIDIVFGNIKHCFYQSADKEAIVLIHFHLHHGIMIGKKKSNDVQFFVQVLDQAQSIDGSGNKRGNGRGGNRSNMSEKDEMDEEQAERERRNKINEDFKAFVEKVENLHSNLEFDIPYRELGFYGVHDRSTTFLQPTVACLVQLVDLPFFVLTLSDVEIAHFERVQMSLKNFDMVFVFKDLKRSPAHVNSIPVSYLEPIKNWLNQCDIKYYEGGHSLNWKTLLKTIRDDPKSFWKAGGWSFLDLEQGSSGESEDGEQSDDYKCSDQDDDEEYEESDGEGGGDGGDYEDDDSGGDDGEEEEEDDEGEDWDEQERRAAKEDKEKVFDEDVRDRNKGKKGETGAATRKRKRNDEYSDDDDDAPVVVSKKSKTSTGAKGKTTSSSSSSSSATKKKTTTAASKAKKAGAATTTKKSSSSSSSSGASNTRSRASSGGKPPAKAATKK
eukprot:TRINITY_DN807_c4_g1_i1.p1 TRINITY_DN807_c4_g1~~TRINITY_DN807_c4_g1_i1.p1  ORF type:complete len:963 (+),score=348.91 TRINITY_DN807_c4_g1_i1:399-2891(+)